MTAQWAAGESWPESGESEESGGAEPIFFRRPFFFFSAGISKDAVYIPWKRTGGGPCLPTTKLKTNKNAARNEIKNYVFSPLTTNGNKHSGPANNTAKKVVKTQIKFRALKKCQT